MSEKEHRQLERERQQEARRRAVGEVATEKPERRFTKTNQLIAIAGALVLIVGMFAPLIQVPILGNINIFNQGKGYGVIILIIAALAIVFAITKHFRFHFYGGAIVLADLIFIFYRFSSKLSAARSQMDRDVGNPFRGLSVAGF